MVNCPNVRLVPPGCQCLYEVQLTRREIKDRKRNLIKMEKVCKGKVIPPYHIMGCEAHRKTVLPLGLKPSRKTSK